MDAGNGTLGKLQEHWDINQVDAIWVSHAHADHCADLYPFFFHTYVTGRTVPVYSPSGVSDRMSGLVGPDSLNAWQTRLEWHDVNAGDEGTIGPFAIKGFASQHSATNTVLRLAADDKVLTYTGDTGPHEDLVKAAADADLFLCEASWVDPAQAFAPIHLLARQAGEIAAAAGAGRTVLTHVWSANDPDRVLEEAAAAYDGPLELAFNANPIEV